MIPQAFTTRDMSEAYKWLHTLPANVREEMKSMEQVVTLYLRAKRLGGVLPTKEDIEGYKSLPSDSKGSQEFQQTLKNLKQEMDRFGQVQAPPQNHGVPNQASYQALGQASGQPPATPPHEHIEESQVHTQQTQNPFSAVRMDPKSRQIIGEIREGLNLGSDAEVIRMCLVLGHKTLRDLLK